MLANVAMEPGSSTQQRDLAMGELLDSMQRMDDKLKQESGSGVIKHSIAFDEGDLAGFYFLLN